MELLDALRVYKCPDENWPGVHDIHSPRVLDTDEMKHLRMLAQGTNNRRE
jgi:5-methyltetrahydropteroyltriglutamate--homocysteine methyltransferase